MAAKCHGSSPRFNLGLVLQDLDEMQEARICLENVLKIFRERIGEDHQGTKAVLDPTFRTLTS